MKKLFLAICFISQILIQPLSAKVIEMNDIDKAQAGGRKVIDTSLPSGMPDPNNNEEVISFFRERFRNANVSYVSDADDLNKSDSVNIQHSEEYIAQMQEENKSVFEKIYDNAINRITNGVSEKTADSGTIFYKMADNEVRNQIDEMQMPNVPVVNVMLPTGTKIVAPAREHIPYMLASYEILPTGLIQVQEDVTVVANGQKLKNGLIKILNKNSISRANVRKKIDIQLLSVTVNGQEIPYVLEEIGDKIYIKPQQEYTLQPGVYTYSFKYLLDRKLWYYDDFSEFYVDVTGSYLNLVITSANAIISVPDGRQFMGQNVIVGSKNYGYSARRAMAASLDTNALGFASVTPLLPGEGMHLLVSLDKDVFIEPDADRRFVWFVTDYGDILFSLAGLCTILISYLLSWRYIKRSKQIKKSSYVGSAASLRYFATNRFDNRTFVTALLDLAMKNFIDIQKQDNTFLLVKKTDNLRSLSSYEKKAVNDLFPNKETVLSISAVQALKLNRAKKALEKGILRSKKMISLQFNIGYLFFSIAMLIAAETAISYLAVNPVQMSLILFSSTAMMAFYMWMAKRVFKNKIINVAIKVFAGLFVLFSIFFMSIYIKLISAFFIAAMVYAIFEFDELFAKRSGIIKSKLKEAEDLRKYLIDNAQTIGKSMAFKARQPYIFALELENYYPKNEYNSAAYKLDIAAQITSVI